MHARVATGSAPPGRPAVVLVHGQVVSSRYMTPLMEWLGRDFPMFAPDLPGFGRSDRPPRVLTIPELADALAAWLDAAGIGRAALLGNSLGCQIAVEFALRRPERAFALVLQGPTADPRARTARQQLGRILRNSWREESPGIGPLLDYAQAGLRRAVRTFRYLVADEIEAKLPRVRVPALVVRGAMDPVVPQDWAEEVARLLPDGRLVVVPGAAHTMVTVAPLELARVARPFLLDAASCGVRRHRNLEPETRRHDEDQAAAFLHR